MKLLVALALVILIFLGIGLNTQQQVLRITSDMQEKLPKISRSINDGDWKAAQRETETLMKTWNSIQDRFDLFVSHHEIDALEIILARLLSYISSEDDASALAELAELNTKLSHIYRKEIFNLQNVL